MCQRAEAVDPHSFFHACRLVGSQLQPHPLQKMNTTRRRRLFCVHTILISTPMCCGRFANHKVNNHVCMC
ncbi:hypothetical protein RSAG8_00573, partial [Rhizoctonia solani AG-8 WAC10335]